MRSVEQINEAVVRAESAPYVVVDVGSQERPLVTVADLAQFPDQTLWVCVDKDPHFAAGNQYVPAIPQVIHLLVPHSEAFRPRWLNQPKLVDEVYFGNVLGEPHTDHSTWKERIRIGSRRADKIAALRHAWKILKPAGTLTIFEDLTPELNTVSQLVVDSSIGEPIVTLTSSSDWDSLLQRYQQGYQTREDFPKRLTWGREEGKDDPSFFMRLVKGSSVAASGSPPVD